MKHKILAALVTALALLALSFSAYASSYPTSIGGLGIENSHADLNLASFSGATSADASGNASIYHYSGVAVPSQGAIVDLYVEASDATSFNIQLHVGAYGADAVAPTYSPNQITAVETDLSRDGQMRVVLPAYWDGGININVTIGGGSGVSYRYTLKYSVLSLNTQPVYEQGYGYGYFVGEGDGYASGYTDGLARGTDDAGSLTTFVTDILTGVSAFFAPLAEVEVFGITPLSMLSLLFVAGIAVLILRLRS